MEEKKKKSSKVTQVFKLKNDDGTPNWNKIIIGVILALAGSFFGGTQMYNPSQQFEDKHQEAMDVLMQIRDVGRETNHHLLEMRKGQERHEKEAEKREGRIMKKLDEVHSDIKKK